MESEEWRVEIDMVFDKCQKLYLISTLHSAAEGRENSPLFFYLSFLYQFTVTIHGFIGEHCFCWLPMKV